jgi:hypothetical protein
MVLVVNEVVRGSTAKAFFELIVISVATVSGTMNVG